MADDTTAVSRAYCTADLPESDIWHTGSKHEATKRELAEPTVESKGIRNQGFAYPNSNVHALALCTTTACTPNSI